MADWIARINEKLDALGLYPDVEAYEITDLRDHLVLTDTQEVTVYRSPEGCYRLLSLVEAVEDDGYETYQAVGEALRPNEVEGVRVIEDDGLWRQDPETETIEE